MRAVSGGIKGWRQRTLRDMGIDRMTRKQRRDSALLLASIALSAALLGWSTNGTEFPSAFYETVAAVIPVFLLAVALERGMFRDEPSAAADIRFGRRLLLIAVVLGEALCLAVIAYGQDPLLVRGVVLFTLVAMGCAVVIAAMKESSSSSAPTRPTADANAHGKLGVMDLPVLKGERLTLRPLTDDDVEILLPAIYEPGTVEWWGDTSDLDYQREGLRNEGNAFAIVVGDEVAGWLSFDEETEPDYREVAFDILLRPAFQRQGLGAEALRTLIRWFIDARGHHRFTIDPSAKNDRAIKAYRSIGFKPVGILRKAERAPDGHWRDSLLMDLLIDEL
jgi:aminoglycoside 6'-N-acetyltransferase